MSLTFREIYIDPYDRPLDIVGIQRRVRNRKERRCKRCALHQRRQVALRNTTTEDVRAHRPADNESTNTYAPLLIKNGTTGI